MRCNPSPAEALRFAASEPRSHRVIDLLVHRRRLFLGGVALACALLFLWDHYRLIFVMGQSMRPTYMTGDLLIVDKWAYHWAEPGRGEVVVAHHWRDLIIKRVVGLPGEEVAVVRGSVFINGARMVETYSRMPGSLEISAGRLAEGKFALLGDNRQLAGSQIVHAVVSKNEILGRVVAHWRLWPRPKTDSAAQ